MCVVLVQNTKQFFKATMPLNTPKLCMRELCMVVLLSTTHIFCLFHWSYFGWCVGLTFEDPFGKEQ